MQSNPISYSFFAALIGLAGLVPVRVAANAFTATYTIQMSVDASKAKPESASDRALVQGAACWARSKSARWSTRAR